MRSESRISRVVIDQKVITFIRKMRTMRLTFVVIFFAALTAGGAWWWQTHHKAAPQESVLALKEEQRRADALYDSLGTLDFSIREAQETEDSVPQALVDEQARVWKRYADLRRQRISLWEQREVRRVLRSQGHAAVSESLIFRSLEQQRDLVARALSSTRVAKHRRERATNVLPLPAWTPSALDAPPEPIDYSKPVIPYHAEIW